jgi:hypothetical protein
VDTAVEELVWAHLFGPAEAREVATEYFVRDGLRIQVGTICDCALCLMCVEGLVLLAQAVVATIFLYFIFLVTFFYFGVSEMNRIIIAWANSRP